MVDLCGMSTEILKDARTRKATRRGENQTSTRRARGTPNPCGNNRCIIFPPGTSGGSELRLRWGLGSFSFSLPPLLGGAAVFFSFGFLWFSLVFFWFSSGFLLFSLGFLLFSLGFLLFSSGFLTVLNRRKLKKTKEN